MSITFTVEYLEPTPTKKRDNFLEEFLEHLRSNKFQKLHSLKAKFETNIPSYEKAKEFAYEKLEALVKSNTEILSSDITFKIYSDTLIACEEYSTHPYCHAGFEYYVNRELVESIKDQKMVETPHDDL